ncbi:amidase [Paraburkholderia sp. J63]|uniref:amidase n=1 Tax=Paraburkholderia sp. J63 TaxID=2805434 RepID=UPI002ABE34E0|nr:amidase [Paraburkholderia sp. J63]
MKTLDTESAARLSAAAAAAQIRAGRLSATDLLEACIERIEARDDAVRAWEHLDLAGARAAARRLDAGPQHGVLHGVVVGIKDMIDTAGMPTRYGSPIYAAHQPQEDAACVRRLREAGAIVLGKTVTTEFAAYHAGKTRHPHDPRHTPGGSSSGSAAAVADFQAGIALGTQTSGSTIRPASFNGVLGYKPTFGRFDVAGIKPLAPSLDTLGFLARSFADFDLIGQAFGLAADVPRPARALRVGVCRTDRWLSAEVPMRDAFERTAAKLAAHGAQLSEVVLPSQFDQLHGAHQIVMCREAARAYTYERHAHGARLSAAFRQLLADGLSYAELDEQEAWRQVHACREYFRMVMRDVDVLLTPAAPGEAPSDPVFTGNPVFNRVWTLLGVPCVTFPVDRGAAQLPLGVQVVGPVGGDEALLACAAWMAGHTAVSIG